MHFKYNLFIYSDFNVRTTNITGFRVSPSNNEVKTICSANVRRMNDMYKEDDSTSAAVLVEDGSFSWGADAPILIQLVVFFHT